MNAECGEKGIRMSKKSAKDYFRGVEKYNCAQAVVKAFQEEFNIPEEVVESYASKGAGQAEGNLCGSLYAAEKLLKDPEKIVHLEKLFAGEAGSIKCKEIRKLRRLSCKGTVELAERIIKELTVNRDDG